MSHFPRDQEVRTNYCLRLLVVPGIHKPTSNVQKVYRPPGGLAPQFEEHCCRTQECVTCTIVRLRRVTAAVKVSKRKKKFLTQEEILKLLNKSDSELNDLSDDDYAANKTYELRTLEEESSSDESNDEKQ
ncbi:hypothetical protein TNCV_4557281 [Trichonephila clavipes]|nr:hypothetical protein TNCV_4557281 [Trichonephila clavipes]